MNKEDYNRVLSFLGSNIENCFDISNMIFDEKINDCLSKLYFTMICDNKEEQEEYYNEFENMYKELNEEQKEIVKGEIAKILKIEYKPKIKKKERR